MIYYRGAPRADTTFSWELQIFLLSKKKVPRRTNFGGRRKKNTNGVAIHHFFRSCPGKPNQRKGQNEKFMSFAHFCEFWCFSLGKQARFTSRTFVPECPCEKFMNWPFLVWFAGVTPDFCYLVVVFLVRKGPLGKGDDDDQDPVAKDLRHI